MRLNLPRIRRERNRSDRPTGDAPADTSHDATADDVDDEQLLATPLDDSDLGERLIAASGRGRARSTLVLAAIALFVFGFAAGTATGQTVAQLAASAAEQDAGEGGIVVVPGSDELHVAGTVRFVDGDTVMVERPDRTIVRVEVTAATTILSTQPSALDDVPPGTGVHVFGDPDARGVVAATELITTQQR